MTESGERLVSGGQTGADRGGLDWSTAHGVAHGGSPPKGDGTVQRAHLKSAFSPDAPRCESVYANTRCLDVVQANRHGLPINIIHDQQTALF
jgi:hypothetical protein